MMKGERKAWNARQKELRALLGDPARYDEALPVFLRQHGAVHAGEMSSTADFSFQDGALSGLTEVQMRVVPEAMEHSIAWVLWHLARIEDAVMNALVAGEDQLFHREGWGGNLAVPMGHTGNAMTEEEVIRLSQEVDVDQLLAYRTAVGRETEGIVRDLDPGRLTRPVPPDRLAGLLEVGTVTEKSSGQLDYWGNRTVAGLLLMPPTRHCFVHLNEAARIRKKLLSERMA